ncbi:UDP-N-acetylmuramate--L-alanine ligase [Blochmannia endosymbiont of Colobopsis nipponica]|uniref:UDP-N-acetylmuramate--L-alanine ligase n=1 Tax=Blochmannia endosymbiont of Colobopsis nipponica TaxID=2681987 RepID=UPI00177C1E02|nr:UDP-N-acetylmuramate--L-alanine ligase [Blochmannia endosymbiont of Colobopsis nipponica]QOI11265.1 UDP-N-acetylmuramate--L-alanine ligase [Blochmannia endosymbiont of Colobopsis nipponica]
MNYQRLTELHTFNPKMNRIKQVHFVGIGGSSMGGIAEILANKGYRISGSDVVSNKLIKRLVSLGIKIFFNHHPANVNNANVVVISSAISQDNPEVLAARKACIPIIKRAEMLAELMRFRYGIAVAGTHGKTTTTAMLASIYMQAGLDPTFIIGGEIKAIGVNAQLGYGPYLIVEADESDASFLFLRPIIEIITNIDADHIDAYEGNFNNLKKTFINFMHKIPFYGSVIVCIDDPIIKELIPKINRHIVTYGFSPDADFSICGYSQQEEKISFLLKKDGSLLQVTLNMPGRHNALNAAAAIAVAFEEGISNRTILQAISQYQGTCRRFECLGNYNLKDINGKQGTVMLIHDYGHHPTELDVTIRAIRNGWFNRRLVMIFQPHRFTRMRNLYNDFVRVLSNVDFLLLLNIYSAGENSIPDVDSYSLCKSIRQFGKINPVLALDITQLSCILSVILQNNDLVLMQGAGTIGEIANKLARNNLLL